MGYDSSIKINKSEVTIVDSLLLNIGFKKHDIKKTASFLGSYSKYIDDQCKYREGTFFKIVKVDKKYYVVGRNGAGCTDYDL